MSARIYAMVDGVGEDFDQISASGPLAHGNDMLTVRSVKLFSDGALGSRGGLLAPVLGRSGQPGPAVPHDR